jgi:hypothetical protein
MKTFSYLLLLVVINFSCTSVHLIQHEPSDYDELNQELEGYKVKIIKANKEVILAENVFVMPDSTFWLDALRNRVFTQTSEINELSLKSTWRGAKDGLYYGFLFGAGFGVAVSLLIEKKSGAWDPKAAAPIMGIGGGMGGGIWGLMIGAAIGHTDRYIIEAATDSASIDKY